MGVFGLRSIDVGQSLDSVHQPTPALTPTQPPLTQHFLSAPLHPQQRASKATHKLVGPQHDRNKSCHAQQPCSYCQADVVQTKGQTCSDRVQTAVQTMFRPTLAKLILSTVSWFWTTSGLFRPCSDRCSDLVQTLFRPRSEQGKHTCPNVIVSRECPWRKPRINYTCFFGPKARVQISTYC